MKRAFRVSILCLALLYGCPANPGEEGRDSHDGTRLTSAEAPKGAASPREEPESRKGGQQAIRLPETALSGMPLREALMKRRSVRDYSGEPLELGELSALLFSAQGITGEHKGVKLRAAPSAGALYPMELYVFVHQVSGLEPGLYHYDPFEHALTALRKGDLRGELQGAGLGQEALGEAAAVIALAAVPARTTRKYGERGFRYVYMEAGHIAENILLEAVSLGLGAVPMGAFADRRLDGLLGIDGREEISLYLVAVGKIR